MTGLLKGMLIFSIAWAMAVPSQAVDLGEAALFGAGVITGIYGHELGHATAAVLNGGEVKEIGFAYTNVRIPTSNDPGEDDAKHRSLALGGYVSQTLISEMVLQNKDWRNNSFMLGMMSMGIYVNLSNPIRYYLFGERDNDLGSYATAGGDPLYPSLLMVAYSAFSLYRIFNETNIVPTLI